LEAAAYFYLALLILVLMPVVVLPWEGRTTPDWLYFVLGGCGLAGAALQGGMPALALSCAAGFGCLLVALCAVTALRSRTRARILTGGQIKLLAAGGTWLGVSGAAVMIAVAVFALFLIAAFQRVGAVRRRPDASAIVAIAIVSVAMQQHLPGM
jgi:prepilin signal peptidase PulO-like enzyme (type II secretory pathway)